MVEGCRSKQGRDDVRFFRVTRKRFPHQTQAWLKALNKKNPDGTPWTPNTNSRICSLHFVSGKPSPDSSNCSYAPTLYLNNDTLNFTSEDNDPLNFSSEDPPRIKSEIPDEGSGFTPFEFVSVDQKAPVIKLEPLND